MEQEEESDGHDETEKLPLVVSAKEASPVEVTTSAALSAPEPASTASSSTRVVSTAVSVSGKTVDEKAGYRRYPPAIRPGAVAASASPARNRSETAPAAATSDDDIKARHHCAHASKAGATAVVPVVEPGPAKPAGLYAPSDEKAAYRVHVSTDEAVPDPEKPLGIASVLDPKAAYRLRPASGPGVHSVAAEDITTASVASADEPLTVIDPKVAYRALPAARPGVQSISASEITVVASPDELSHNATIVDPKAAYRALPASRPGVQSVAAADITTAAAGEPSETTVIDPKVACRALPDARPGDQSISASGITGVASLDEPSHNATIVDPKAAYRAWQPASRPGVHSVAAADITAAAAGEPSGTTVIDPKVACRALPDARPGVQSISASEITGVASLDEPSHNATIVDPKAAYRARQPASRPGVQSVAAADVTAAASADEPSRIVTVIDSKASHRCAPPADRPGAQSIGVDEKVTAAKSHAQPSGETAAVDSKATYRTSPVSSPCVLSIAALEESTSVSPATTEVPSASIPQNKSGNDSDSTSERGEAIQSNGPDETFTADDERLNSAQGSSKDGVVVVCTAEEDLMLEKRSKSDSQKMLLVVGAVHAASNEEAVVSALDKDLLKKSDRSASSRMSSSVSGAFYAASDDEALVATVEQGLKGGKATKGTSSHSAKVASAQEDVSSTFQDKESYELCLMSYDESEEIVFMSKEDKEEPCLSLREEQEMNMDGLTVAMPVDEDAEKNELVKAIDFDPKLGPSVHRRPWLVVSVVFVFCSCLAALVIGIVLGINGGDDDTATITESDGLLENTPTASPSLAPTSSREHLLRDWLDTFNFSRESLESSVVAFDMAVNWYANVDRSRNTSIPDEEYPWDLTRFLMAWFYYATSSNGTKPWVSCNPPDYSTGQSDECTHLRYSTTSIGRTYITYTQRPGTARWLSNYSACEWPGLICLPPNTPVPQQLSACLGSVIIMDMKGFGMTGSLPVMLREMVCLSALDFSWNEGLAGTIHPETFNFRTPESRASYSTLILSENKNIVGTIPDSFWDAPGLADVRLRNNGLSGTVPNFTGKVPNLRSLQIDGMSFGGPLPTLPILPGLTKLSFNGDLIGFNGTIPFEYGALTRLTEFSVYGNDLTGFLPDSIKNWTKMKNFRVRQNNLRGLLPDIFWKDLEEFDIQGNRFEGELPAQLGESTKMKYINVQENRLTGKIDPAIGNMTSLIYLLLNDNQFTGIIPSTLGNLKKMTSLWTNFNNFEGDFPLDICRLRSADGLAWITADCLAYPPQNYCFCCSSCCDTRYRSCQTRDTEVENLVLRRLLPSIGKKRHIMSLYKEDFDAKYYGNLYTAFGTWEELGGGEYG